MIRGKCTERRNAIIAGAMKVFCEHGYSHATMSMIAARIGGSKGTLWAYFRSKEELFAASLAEVRARRDKLAELLKDSEADVIVVLHDFGRSYLNFSTSADALMIRRAIIGNVGLNKLSDVDFFEPIWTMLNDYLSIQKAKGTLRPLGSNICARSLIALIESSYLHPILMAVPPEVTQNKAVADAVNIFLRSYSLVSSE